MKAGNKQRAIIYLKKKKLCAKEAEKAQNTQIMLDETLQNVESAAADVNVMKALKIGDEALKDLHKQVSMEDWEEMYENHEDNKARADMEAELFGEALNDADLEAELEGLVELNAAEQMGDLGPQAAIIP